MEFYFAPLEGVTGFTYRNAYNDLFDDMDKYMHLSYPHRLTID